MSKILNFKETKLQIKNVSKTKSVIYIYDQIGKNFFGEGIDAKSFSEELLKVPESANLIEVRINSPGGSVFDGYAIFNRLKQIDKEVHVYIDGVGASIASIIALAGDKVYMAETAQYMIHKPMAFGGGNSDELLKLVDMLDSLENQLVNIYRKKTGIDAFEIEQMLRNETWFTAEQALESGFVDEVITISENEKIVASSDMKKILDKADWLKNKPEIKISDKVKQNINNVIKDIEGFEAR